VPILEERYNEALKKFYEAANIMWDSGLPIQKYDKWMPRFRELLDDLNKIIAEIEEAGHKMTEDEMLVGFRAKHIGR